MKIFLSSMESKDRTKRILEKFGKLKYNLISFYYAKNDIETAKLLRDNSELIMVDSGAHSFQFGKKVDWVEYTKKYAEFIKNFDRPNVVGYFEMDVDNVLGYEKVLELRKILEEVSDKIIPVWHPNRTIQDFKEMCQKYAGKVVSITGFANKEVRDDQYIMFLKYAKKYNCKMHCLGMTRRKILDKVPFDYVDSSTWLQQVNYGNTLTSKRKLPKAKGEEKMLQYILNYGEGMKMQSHYYNKWRKVCKD